MSANRTRTRPRNTAQRYAKSKGYGSYNVEGRWDKLRRCALQVFGQFSRILKALSVHLVEASPAMSSIQEATLTGWTAGSLPHQVRITVLCFIQV